MKIAVLSPTTIQFVEKMASLYPGREIHVVGPAPKDAFGWNDYARRADEWRLLGLNIAFDLRPYDAIDFSRFDVLVETYETLDMEPSWREHCARHECPVVVKACWTKAPYIADLPCPDDYYAKICDSPLLLEMPAHVANWETSGFTDVNLLFNPVGQWWFDAEWTGADDRAVMVLSGKDKWRRKAHHGLDLVERLAADFPGRIHIHDGAVDYKTSKEMAGMLARARVFLVLDEPYGQGERPLSLVFTEALSAGCPVAARDLPGLSFKDYIDGNGVAAKSYDALRAYVGRCLDDLDFARGQSAASRRIALKHFAPAALQPHYEAVFERARRVFERRRAAPPRRIVVSDFARLAIE